jgi:hypothetical protein
MKKTIGVVIVFFVLVGCSRTIPSKYVVMRNVPENPTFAVLPFNNYQDQIMCSDRAVASLIASGVKVVTWREPSSKNVEIRKGAVAGQAQIDKDRNGDRVNDSKNVLGEAKLSQTRIEKYIEYEDIKADYLVKINGNVTYYSGVPYINSINIQIIKKNNYEILASFVSYESSINQDMRGTLKHLGFKVNNDSD